MSDKQPDPKDLHWLVRPNTIKWMWIVGTVLLIAVTALDLVFKSKAYFGIDGSLGFYSWYGLLTCGAMVVGAKALGLILKRKDTYYDR